MQLNYYRKKRLKIHIFEQIRSKSIKKDHKKIVCIQELVMISFEEQISFYFYFYFYCFFARSKVLSHIQLKNMCKFSNLC